MKQILREIARNLARKPKDSVFVTSNGQKATVILKGINAWFRSELLSKKLNQVWKDTRAECCEYDVWPEKISGKPVYFGLIAYVCRDIDGNLSPGIELIFSPSEAMVKNSCEKMKEEIWMPTGLLMPKEQKEQRDHEDGILKGK
jgi:hypothetical protein